MFYLGNSQFKSRINIGTGYKLNESYTKMMKLNEIMVFDDCSRKRDRIKKT